MELSIPMDGSGLELVPESFDCPLLAAPRLSKSEENHPMMLWLMRPVVVRNPRGCVGMFLYFV